MKRSSKSRFLERGIIRPCGFPLMKLAILLEEKLFAVLAAIEELILLPIETICIDSRHN